MQTRTQTPIRAHAIIPRRRAADGPPRMPSLLIGSVAAAAALLGALSMLGHWQVEAGGAAVAQPLSLPATDMPSPVPEASQVLGNPPPVPDEPVATF